MNTYCIRRGFLLFKNPSFSNFLGVLFLACMMPFPSEAQQKIYGNLTIPSGAQLTIFGTQDFSNAVTGGVIRTERTAPFGVLNVGENAALINTGEKGYVDGYVRKLGVSPITFPVGQDGFYGPFSASADKTTGAYFHKSPSSASFPTSSKDMHVGDVSITEYWDIKGENETRITLSWNNLSSLSDFIPRLQLLTIVGWKNGRWVKIPSMVDGSSIFNITSSIATGSITTTNAITPNDFEAFSIGSLVSQSLPVTLTFFRAKPEGNTALLTWETSFETNSDRFEIERSAKGKDWKGIGVVKSSVESNAPQLYAFTDLRPKAGENFYRLKMIDTDETSAYSMIRVVTMDRVQEEYVVYPNPASNLIKLKAGEQDMNLSQAKITDVNGRDLTNMITWVGTDINIEKLSNGLYVITIQGQDGDKVKSKFAVKK